ncbi:ABC transporter permease, partial [Shimia sp.]|uniref:ABC transporter permease n=1 Tax=Shimia sp. TaxID=1954381 RepID=UPI003563E070
IGIGMVLLALKPWFPGFVGILTTVYQRANMIASGKMFVANTLPTFMLNMFDWNPLFHSIDQSRGFAFINYAPRNTSIEYPLLFGVVFLMLGLMGEFYTRRRASLSWSARQ